MAETTVTVIAGHWESELFVFPPQVNPNVQSQYYLPLMLGGHKIFLTKESAKELADSLMGFVDG